MMSFLDALTYASTPNGIALVVGIILSILAEYWPKYHKFDKKTKRLVMAAASVFIPLAALLLGALCYDQPVDVDAIWAAVLAGGAAFSSSQFAHLRKMGGTDGTKGA